MNFLWSVGVGVAEEATDTSLPSVDQVKTDLDLQGLATIPGVRRRAAGGRTQVSHAGPRS